MNFTIPFQPEPKKTTPCPRLPVRMALLLSACTGIFLAQTCPAETTPASGAQEIASLPGTITQPGTYYLKQDFQVNMVSGVALSINASDVTVDMNGHTISNLAVGSQVTARGIHSYNQSNITIRNGKIIGFHHGMNLEADNVTNPVVFGHLVEDMYVTSCNFLGLVVCGSNSTVRRCRVNKIGGTSTNNAIWPASIIVTGKSPRVLDCDVGEGVANAWGSGTTGIVCHTTTDAIIEGNRVAQVTHAIAYIGAATFKYRDTLTGAMAIPYLVGSGGIDAGGNN
jgi:hypothetical protein